MVLTALMAPTALTALMAPTALTALMAPTLVLIKYLQDEKVFNILIYSI
ncbi:MAG: hypothetical protein ACFFG0_28195 [Candidatus Thorarchaeota archaeon]